MMLFGAAPRPSGAPPGVLQTECLFSGPLPLLFRSAMSTTAAGDARRSESVVAELYLVPTTSSKRALEIKLTDSADPFFLWQCTLSEEDYFAMRREQGLVVDFLRFPAFLTSLFEKCQQHFDEHQPLFGAYFWAEQQQAVLSLVETNEFKQNNYVVLRMTPVSDTALRKHLSGLLQNFREEIHSLRSTGTLPRGLASALPTGRENTTTTAPTATTPAPNVSLCKQPTVNYVERCRSLEERLASCEQQLAEHRDSRGRLENEAAELRGQTRALNLENERLKQEVYSFKSSAQGAGISARLAGLEQLVREKDEALSRMNDLVQETREAKQLLEGQVSQFKGQIAGLQDANHSVQADLAKANDTIRKMQEDLRNAKNKVRSASTLAQEHERLHRESGAHYEAVKKDLSGLQERYEARVKEIGELEEAKRSLAMELDEARRLNEGNDKVIAWLHRQISDDRLNYIIEHGETDTSVVIAAEKETTRETKEASTIESERFPLVERFEARQFFRDLGHRIDPDTSLPRFTPDELAEKEHVGGGGSSSGGSGGGDQDDMDRRLEGLTIV